MSTNIVYLAGESVLSEYHEELQKKYGIFAIRKDDQYLSERAEHYIDASFWGFNNVVKIKAVKVKASAKQYGADDKELLKKQLVGMGLLCTAKKGFEEVVTALNTENTSSSQINSQFDALESAANDDENVAVDRTTKQKARKKIKELKRQYKDATRNYGTPSLLLTGDFLHISADTLAMNEYFLKVRQGADIEYLLYGYDKDFVNKACFKNSLFWTRVALNMKHLLNDPIVKAEIDACVALLALIYIPEQVSYPLVVSVFSAVYADLDVIKICNGGTVPVVESVKEFGDYDDYLRLFLILVSDDRKIDRFMKLVEKRIDNFKFKDYAYGFNLQVEVKKKTYAPGYKTRKKTIEQVHSYE